MVAFSVATPENGEASRAKQVPGKRGNGTKAPYEGVTTQVTWSRKTGQRFRARFTVLWTVMRTRFPAILRAERGVWDPKTKRYKTAGEHEMTLRLGENNRYLVTDSGILALPMAGGDIILPAGKGIVADLYYFEDYVDDGPDDDDDDEPGEPFSTGGGGIAAPASPDSEFGDVPTSGRTFEQLRIELPKYQLAIQHFREMEGPVSVVYPSADSRLVHLSHAEQMALVPEIRARAGLTDHWEREVESERFYVSATRYRNGEFRVSAEPARTPALPAPRRHDQGPANVRGHPA